MKKPAPFPEQARATANTDTAPTTEQSKGGKDEAA